MFYSKEPNFEVAKKKQCFPSPDLMSYKRVSLPEQTSALSSSRNLLSTQQYEYILYSTTLTTGDLKKKEENELMIMLARAPQPPHQWRNTC